MLIHNIIYICRMSRVNVWHLIGVACMFHTTFRRVHDSWKYLIGSWSIIHRNALLSSLSDYTYSL
jgi:hypothetical protein